MAQHPLVQRAFKIHRVPMAFVHVPAGLHFGVLFAEFERVVGVAFQVDAESLAVEAGDGKYFTHDPQAQCHLVEREILRSSFLGKAVFAKLFDVHN